MGEVAKSSVSGSAAYRERMALPPGAVFEAVLEDVSKADAAAEVLGTARIEEPGNPPFDFRIDFDPARIDERHTYAVRARILVDGKLFFTTDQHHPVLTRGAPDTVTMGMKHVAGEAGVAKPLGPTPTGPTATLEGTYWKLTWLADAQVEVVEGQREPHIVFDAESMGVHGSGGCNRLTGSYMLEGDSLTLGPVATTMMACIDGMETEYAFLKALGLVTGYKLDGEKLEVSDAAGQALASFEAVYLR